MDSARGRACGTRRVALMCAYDVGLALLAQIPWALVPSGSLPPGPGSILAR